MRLPRCYHKIIGFILLVGFFNLFIGSMSAKYAMVAPIFIPMLMVVGISPELTQATYRIGDSVSNVITPLNAYLLAEVIDAAGLPPPSAVRRESLRSS